MNKKGRVGRRTNYFVLMILSIALIFIGGNISSALFTIPTFGVSNAIIAGSITAFGAIIGLYITLRISLLRI